MMRMISNDEVDYELDNKHELVMHLQHDEPILCQGKFFWLAGFGKQTVKLSDTLPKTSLFPVWGMQTHFKVTRKMHTGLNPPKLSQVQQFINCL